jgi:SAM-dependent methyltransferase
MITINSELETLKTRLKTTWMTGDYGHFSTYMESGALTFLERLAITPGTQMLDVACGAGQIAIPAARSGAMVVGVDISTNWLEQARSRADREGVAVQFDEGDAERLPYDDASFDLVVSLIGAMFAPQPERVAAELIRVCRSKGRIVMANWTPEGFVGQMFQIIGQHVPPSPLIVSPVKWGDPAIVRERLQHGIAKLETTKYLYPMCYPFAPAAVVEFFRAYYGPANRAFAALDDLGQNALRHDLEQLWERYNLAQDGSTHVEAEYLEVIATRS